MTQYKFDVTIIGAGIIGLGTAISILKKHPKIKLAILEKDGLIFFPVLSSFSQLNN